MPPKSPSGVWKHTPAKEAENLVLRKPEPDGSVHQMKTIIAIDSGVSGGLAIHRESQPVQAYPMPQTEGDLVDLLREIAPDPANTAAFVEEVGGYIGKAQPASSAFKFGRGFGFILGCIQALGVRLELVRPAKWQKPLGLGTATNCASKTEWKNKLKAQAQRLYPALKVTLATADALLILDFALQTGDHRDDKSNSAVPANDNRPSKT